MNELELALLDTSGKTLDAYLEVTSTKQIMLEIAEIKYKAAISTDAGALKMRIMSVLNETN